MEEISFLSREETMKLSLIHLTDIHFTNQNNSILSKQELLWNALKAELRSTDQILCCISGDIAQSGQEDEYYNIAIPFFDNLQGELEKELNINMEFLIIPGNHDCNFGDTGKNATRDILIESIVNQSKINVTEHTIKSIKVQQEFEDFRELYHSQWKNCELIYDDELLQRVALKISDFSIIFNLFNSSWISTLKENPGHMVFPIEQYKQKLNQCNIGDFNITMIHHPDHWLKPENKRELKDFLESISDFILTGHEHVQTNFTKTTWENNRIQYCWQSTPMSLYIY